MVEPSEMSGKTLKKPSEMGGKNMNTWKIPEKTTNNSELSKSISFRE